MKNSSSVPAFLTKLWTLVEDGDTNEFICWSPEGNSFLVLDEQRFAKEILPKFFKHNNMASFIRQLNMYGFRKVMHIDAGIIKQERDGPVEFQHPYFRRGRDDLLENIKRKVSNTRPEESKLRQEDLSKILSCVQTVHDKQETMDIRLATLKRENEALWREMSDLRQKHAQQQEAIKKLVHFIITLVQNNRVLNLKRKRPLLLSSNGKKSKFISEIFEEPVEHGNSAVSEINGMNSSSDLSDEVIICDITNEDAEVTVDSRATDDGEIDIIEVNHENDAAAPAGSLSSNHTASVDSPVAGDGEDPASTVSTMPSSSSMQLSHGSLLSQEDPVKMMDSILNESGTISHNINLLGKLELMDYLDSIDCTLEDFQAMLYGKQSGVLQESEDSKEHVLSDKDGSGNADKQLIQYTSCPLLAFLDGCSPLPSVAEPQPEDPKSDAVDLLDSSLGTDETPRSSMIRLEPLTEAEAREATLFYLCELNADLQPPELEV